MCAAPCRDQGGSTVALFYQRRGRCITHRPRRLAMQRTPHAPGCLDVYPRRAPSTLLGASRAKTMTRLSGYLLPTEKQPPADAEAISHKLMVRAGLIRQMGA